ncbi:hypothetical protein EGR_10529 [Echinococcus granulosus]|uniref:Uncharacterized protein n=1 Tax=Echinococcus granulosus TaxID=6210 RepID=W6U0Q1_ECHGR|nr:hypothetical protein EGR_10529 [Echinococcus granulosus]EUB54608.1 hypothetical protein EGR_10529 [Echinococcus granulosus]
MNNLSNGAKMVSRGLMDSLKVEICLQDEQGRKCKIDVLSNGHEFFSVWNCSGYYLVHIQSCVDRWKNGFTIAFYSRQTLEVQSGNLGEEEFHNSKSGVYILCFCNCVCVELPLRYNFEQQFMVEVAKIWKKKKYFIPPLVIYCLQDLGTKRFVRMDAPHKEQCASIRFSMTLYLWNKRCLVLCDSYGSHRL